MELIRAMPSGNQSKWMRIWLAGLCDDGRDGSELSSVVNNPHAAYSFW